MRDPDFPDCWSCGRPGVPRNDYATELRCPDGEDVFWYPYAVPGKVFAESRMLPTYRGGTVDEPYMDHTGGLLYVA